MKTQLYHRRQFPLPQGLWGVVCAACLLLSGRLSPSLWGDELKSSGAFVALSNVQGVIILEGTRPVLCYQRAVTSQEGRWPRAHYVHPLYDLDGQCVTEDFPADHGHQRGVYWAWHQVLVAGQPAGDAWACVDFQWDVRDVTIATTAAQASLVATVIWKSPAVNNQQGQPLPLVHERTTIVVHRAHDEVRWIDFSIELLALLEGVEIGGSADEKGYGGFSARLKLSDATRFTGVGGRIEPELTAVEAGPAVDIADLKKGVAIFSHPDNPNFPPAWIVRSSQSMQNAVYPGRQPILLSPVKPLKLRYRVGLHRGQWTAVQIGEHQRQYQKSLETESTLIK